MQKLAKPTVQQGHLYEVKISNGSDGEGNDLTYEKKHVDDDDNQRVEEEETTISEIVKVISNC